MLFQELQFSYYASVKLLSSDPEELLQFMDNLDCDFSDDDFEVYIDEDESLEQTTHRQISVQQEVLLCTNSWLPRSAVATGHEGSPMLIRCLSSIQTKVAYFTTSEHIVFDSQKSMQHGAPPRR